MQNHEQGIVNVDVFPSNLLVRSSMFVILILSYAGKSSNCTNPGPSLKSRHDQDTGCNKAEAGSEEGLVQKTSGTGDKNQPAKWQPTIFLLKSQGYACRSALKTLNGGNRFFRQNKTHLSY
jgi:hypothetical protein